ncbi:PaaI family thioesterase [Caballeronia sp. LP006]|uniref:PaaI family thioesterase n=1 Tax=unclassified Caballeronia TaxID=2646786 RepID=UPI001FD08C4B|nr:MULTISPECIES: PaaI family thioesterase [unclassified Caballeronia]MDR5801068.1 PaaI family thioesterase [Caballeronia sp. LZ001]MDR5829260.1 PaaI family thioesterase [Caballeronia sp. LP006]
MAELVDIARGALNAQPFSALLGTKLMQVDAASLTLCLPIRDELRQQHGFVHGGVVSYLVDNALTFAGALRLGPKVVTGEYKINYLRPAVSGTLMARARVVHAGMTQATCQCDVFVTDGNAETLVAVAQGTITRISESAAEALYNA